MQTNRNSLIFTNDKGELYTYETKQSEIIKIDHKRQFNEILKNNKNVIVGFFATWCRACIAMKPNFKKASTDASLKNYKFLEVDFDKFRPLAAEYGVTLLPTIMKINNNIVEKKLIGFMSAPKLIEELNG